MAAAAIGGALLAALALVAGSAGAAPETVRFPSAQSGTTLVGYLYRPAGDGPFPAAVLLHEVTLRVDWQDGDRVRQVELQTLLPQNGGEAP